MLLEHIKAIFLIIFFYTDSLFFFVYKKLLTSPGHIVSINNCTELVSLCDHFFAPIRVKTWMPVLLLLIRKYSQQRGLIPVLTG